MSTKNKEKANIYWLIASIAVASSFIAVFFCLLLTIKMPMLLGAALVIAGVGLGASATGALVSNIKTHYTVN